VSGDADDYTPILPSTRPPVRAHAIGARTAPTPGPSHRVDTSPTTSSSSSGSAGRGRGLLPTERRAPPPPPGPRPEILRSEPTSPHLGIPAERSAASDPETVPPIDLVKWNPIAAARKLSRAAAALLPAPRPDMRGSGVPRDQQTSPPPPVPPRVADSPRGPPRFSPPRTAPPSTSQAQNAPTMQNRPPYNPDSQGGRAIAALDPNADWRRLSTGPPSYRAPPPPPVHGQPGSTSPCSPQSTGSKASSSTTCCTHASAHTTRWGSRWDVSRVEREERREWRTRFFE
jgi:hypothetical protein